MKRVLSFLFFILLTSFTALSYTGCVPSDSGGSVFQYRENLSEVSGDIKISDKTYRVRWTLEETQKIEILTPENISGCVFLRENSNIYAEFNEMKIPLSEKLASGVLPLFSLFELSDGDIINISKTDNGKTEVTASKDNGTYTVLQNGEGFPEIIRFKGDREFEVSGFDFVIAENGENGTE